LFITQYLTIIRQYQLVALTEFVNSYRPGKTVILSYILQLFITQYLTIGRQYRLAVFAKFIN